MRQVIRRGLQEVVVEEVPDPVVAPNHVLIRPHYSLISSGTETASLHRDGLLKEVLDNPSHLRKIWEATKVAGPVRTLAEVKAKFSEYAVLGYSGAGVVVDRQTAPGLEVGDRVAYGGEGTGHAETVLAGRNLVVKVPDSVPFGHASFATLGSIALNAVRLASIQLGEVVAVIGLGLVGQLIAQLARLQGGVVIAIDLKADRVDLARRLGADHGIAAGASLAQAVGALTDGRGADRVIVAAAAKSSVPCRQAVEIAKERARLVVVGAVELSFLWAQMYAKQIQLSMSRAYGPGSYDPVYETEGRDYPFAYVRWTENRNMREFLRLLAAGRVQIQPLITHEFPLDQAANAYGAILDPRTGSLAVLLRYPPAASPAPSFEPRRKIVIAPRPAGGTDLRVALVGAGNIARWAHLPNLGRIPGVRLQAICSTSGARAKSYGLRFRAAYSCTDYQEILADPEVDVVLIANRHHHHAAQALAAVRAGKHVFLEKPMALTEAECRALWQAVDETGRHLTVGFNRRFAPLYRELKRHLNRRTGAAVINCRVSSVFSVSHWSADPSLGGAILGEACHFVDLMYWLLGSEPVSVSASSLPTATRDPIGLNNIASSFRFADGSIASLTYCTVGSRTSGGERVEVFAAGLEAGIEDFKRLSVRGTLHHDRRQWWPDKGHTAHLESFLSGIREGRAPEIGVRDGARATVACLAMLESARSMRPREIEVDALRP